MHNVYDQRHHEGGTNPKTPSIDWPIGFICAVSIAMDLMTAQWVFRIATAIR